MGHVTQKHRSHISSKRAKYPFGKFRKVSKLELKEWHDRFKTMEDNNVKKEYNMEKDIKETVDKLTRLVNNFDISASKFADELCNKTHPTLQQNAMRLFIACIKRWSEKYKNCYDLRCEATCKMSKEIMDKLGDNIYLPMI